ncbi:hypothetical protein F8A87_11030 [Betaproteobacteria bacterium SCN2]|jgi:hypothetical protein|nr:hypothetical protein F8A87_11030 [Betaproteobacteria bacterium SCN2]
MSEYNEDAYRNARKSVNPSPCAFEKGVLARCISCSKAEKHLLAERETMNCIDPAAQVRCTELKTLLRGHSAFALKIPHVGAQLPHAKELKIQCGGLKGLQMACHGNDAVEDVFALIESALSAHGALEDFPYSDVVQGVVHFEARRRG